MINSRSRIILFMLFTLHFVSKSMGDELKKRDESATISGISTRPVNLIIEAVIGIVIAIIGISLGIFLGYCCLQRRSHVHPSKSIKTREIRAIPKGESTSTSKQLKMPQSSKQHGPTIDITEAEDLPDSLFATQTIYESKHASSSMINLAPSQQPSQPTAESQEMIRSHSG